MENKKIYMILGVVAVAGAAIYMMKKKETLESGMRLGASNGGDDMSGGNIEIFSELQKLYGSKVRIENARGNGQYRYYCVSKKDQKKADAGLEIGDEALINGTDVCTIMKWTNYLKMRKEYMEVQ